ncbi:hypothetical protein [Actinomadura chibensis]|uniref:Uncharacterized protein n=1 Tax=Actinomadura chibensis TaxID=392828 RepID=A0A5D0NMR2_9ACTN|nr:hypothetical protein [Actinomadura chibensis]TYB45579.1 hypothetical protein FXF69_19315 [Actinomadura chibensis]
MIAFLAGVACHLGVVGFTVTAAVTAPLRGDRVADAVPRLVRSRPWVVGLGTFLIGLELQALAFWLLPLAEVLGIFSTTLAALLGLSAVLLGERPSGRERLGAVLFAAAAVLVGIPSMLPGAEMPVDRVPSRALLLSLVIPALVIPVVVCVLGERRAMGRHARQQPGTAYGLGAGLILGACGVAVKGLVVVSGAEGGWTSVLAEPYLYLILLAAGVGAVHLTIALQRCRLVTCQSACTVTAGSYLIIVASVLYGGDWPDRPLSGLLLILAAGFAVAAITTFLRRAADPAERSPEAHISVRLSVLWNSPRLRPLKELLRA